VGNEFSRSRKVERVHLATGRMEGFVIYSFEMHKPLQLASSLICNGDGACLLERP